MYSVKPKPHNIKEEDTAKTRGRDTSARSMATAKNNAIPDAATAVQEMEMKQKGKEEVKEADLQGYGDGDLDEYYFQDPSSFGKVNVNCYHNP